MALTSSGEVVLLATLLGIAAADLTSAAVATLAVTAVALRWGAVSLEAIAGAQAVLGPGASVGPLAAAASMWCAGGALLLSRAPGWAAPVFGVAAGLALAGPAATGAGPVVVRLSAAFAGAFVAVVVRRRAPRSARPVALALALAAVALSLWARA